MGRKSMEKAWNSSWSKAYNIICEYDGVKHGGVVWWHDHAWLPVALGYWCLVMTWQKTETARIIQTCVGIYSLPRFSQMYRVDWKALCSTNGQWQWPETYSKSIPGVFEGKNVEYKSPDLNPNKSPDSHAFYLLKTKLKAERPTNKQQLNSAAAKDWQSITKEETRSLVMSMSARIKAAIACKGFSTKYKKININLWLYLFVQLHLSFWKWGTEYKNGCKS